MVNENSALVRTKRKSPCQRSGSKSSPGDDATIALSAASPSHQQQQPTKTASRVAAPPIALSAGKAHRPGIKYDERIIEIPPSLNRPSHPFPAIPHPPPPQPPTPTRHATKKKGTHPPNSRISRTRRTSLGWCKRQIKQIPNQPQNIEYTQHPQRSHEFVGGRAPGDAPDQTAAIRTFDGPATRRRSGWHLAVGVDC